MTWSRRRVISSSFVNAPMLAVQTMSRSRCRNTRRSEASRRISLCSRVTRTAESKTRCGHLSASLSSRRKSRRNYSKRLILGPRAFRPSSRATERRVGARAASVGHCRALWHAGVPRPAAPRAVPQPLVRVSRKGRRFLQLVRCRGRPGRLSLLLAFTAAERTADRENHEADTGEKKRDRNDDPEQRGSFR